MGKSKMSVLKRKRELRKIEKAAQKRERREQRGAQEPRSPIATKDDLEGYGIVAEDEGADR
jgi:hypothetical protein